MKFLKKLKVRALFAPDTSTSGNTEVVGLDISAELMTLAPGISPVLARYLQNGAGMVATQTKHEWFDDVIKPKSYTVASRTGLDITFGGTVAPEVGYVLDFTTTAGVNVACTARVTAVAGQVATVVVLTGTITPVAATHIAGVISEGNQEGRKYVGGTFHKWPREYNFTEIFDEGFEMSGTLAAISGNANMNSTEKQAEAALKRLAQKMTKAITKGIRYENGKARGHAGINYYLAEQAGANVLAVVTTVTALDFDTMVNGILDKSGETGDLHIVVHGKWAATIRGFNSRTMQVTDTSIGGAVKEYITATGKVIPVIFDNTRPQNTVYFEDWSRIAYVPLNGRAAFIDDEQKDRDGKYRPITGEYTLEVRNAKEAHGAIVIS